MTEENDDEEPATAAQIEKIKKLSALALNRESAAYRKSLTPENLTSDEADDLIEDLRLEQTQAKDDAWAEKQQEKEQAEGDYMVVENAVNDDDKRELLHYKKLNSAQVKTLINHLKANVPNWHKLDNWEIASFVRVLFPNQVKATGGRMASEAANFQLELVQRVASRSASTTVPKSPAPVSSSPPKTGSPNTINPVSVGGPKPSWLVTEKPEASSAPMWRNGLLILILIAGLVVVAQTIWRS